MSKNITHDGVVIKAEGRQVTVRFVQSSACSGCHAKGICSSQDSAEKIVVADSGNVPFAVDDSVRIIVRGSTAWKAVCYAFALPLVLALVCLFVSVAYWGEIMACFATLGLLAVYYFILYLCRGRMGREVEFTVIPA